MANIRLAVGFVWSWASFEELKKSLEERDEFKTVDKAKKIIYRPYAEKYAAKKNQTKKKPSMGGDEEFERGNEGNDGESERSIYSQQEGGIASPKKDPTQLGKILLNEDEISFLTKRNNLDCPQNQENEIEIDKLSGVLSDSEKIKITDEEKPILESILEKLDHKRQEKN